MEKSSRPHVMSGIIYRRMDRLLKDSKLCQENGFPNPLV